jgi:hypothetical protein
MVSRDEYSGEDLLGKILLVVAGFEIGDIVRLRWTGDILRIDGVNEHGSAVLTPIFSKTTELTILPIQYLSSLVEKINV